MLKQTLQLVNGGLMLYQMLSIEGSAGFTGLKDSGAKPTHLWFTRQQWI